MAHKRGSNSSSFIDIIKHYIDLKSEYYQLSFVEKVSVLTGKFALLLITALLGHAILLLFILLIYNLLMVWIGITWLVVLIEIGFIGLLMAIAWIFKDALVINPVANIIVKSLLDGDKNKEDEEDEE